MLSFEKDNSLFFNTSDFGVLIVCNGECFHAIFDCKSKEDSSNKRTTKSVSQYPTITTSATNAYILKEGTEILIQGHRGLDKKFLVRSAPKFNLDAEMVTVELSDVNTDTYDSSVDKYLPKHI
jgi:hypothetical protein